MELTMQDYILETPEAVKMNLKKGKKLCAPMVDDFLGSDYSRIVLVASGSSYNAALCAKEGMEQNLKIPVKIITPFYCENYFCPDKKDYLVFASQSGYSSNIVSAAQKKKKNFPIVCVTGHPESDLARIADKIFDYGLCEEKVGYVTKGVILLAVYFWMFSAEAGQKTGAISKAEYEKCYMELGKAAVWAEEMVGKAKNCFQKFEKEFLSMNRVIFCGTGTGIGTVTEAALKISETVRIPCVICDPEEFLHGYYYQIDPSYTVFLVSDRTETNIRIETIGSAVREVTERVFVIENGSQSSSDKVISLDKSVSWWAAPVIQLPFFQEIAYLVSSCLNTYALHPLAVRMKKWVNAKTENYRKKD